MLPPSLPFITQTLYLDYVASADHHWQKLRPANFAWVLWLLYIYVWVLFADFKSEINRVGLQLNLRPFLTRDFTWG